MVEPTPLKKYEFVRLDHHPNYWGKLKKGSKPPTRYYSYSSIMLDEVINQVLSTEGLFLGQNQSWKPPSSSSFLKGAQPPWHTSTRFDSWGLLSISLLWLYHAVVQKKKDHPCASFTLPCNNTESRILLALCCVLFWMPLLPRTNLCLTTPGWCSMLWFG